MVIARRRLKRLKLPGSAISRQRHQVGQRHQAAVVRARTYRLSRSAGEARSVALGLQHHVVFLAVVDEGGDAARAHHGFQRACRSACTDTPRSAARVAVDDHAHLRPGFLVVGIGADDSPGSPPCAPACGRATAPARRSPGRPAPSGTAGRALRTRPPRDLRCARARRACRRVRRAARRRLRRCSARAGPRAAGRSIALAGVHFLAGAEAAGHARVGALDRLAVADLARPGSPRPAASASTV